MKRIIFAFTLLTIASLPVVFGQVPPKYTYTAQKNFIPVELGAVYLGMPFRDFAAKFDLSLAEADARFGPVEVIVPFEKGNMLKMLFKISPISEADAKKCLTEKTVMRKDPSGDYEETIKRIDPAKVPAGAFVYEINAGFKKGFDLRGYSTKNFGPAKDIYKKGDVGYFYDLQWTKKTRDGLTWLIRYHEEPNSLQLIGIIKGTEWAVD